MASQHSSLDSPEPNSVAASAADNISRHINEDGFFFVKNTEVGKLAEEAWAAGEILRNISIEPYKQACQGDKYQQGIVEFLDRYEVVFQMGWSGTAYYFNHTKKSDRVNELILAYALTPKSVYYGLKGSVGIDIDGTPTSHKMRGYTKKQVQEFKESGYSEQEFDFEEGGL
jgi:hypothetical protein